jgi:tetratricopeptide (TPR) repeat protein
MSPAGNGSSAVAADMRDAVGSERYRTVDVARILGVSANRVRRMVHAGHCAPARHGRAFRFAFQDLVLLRTAHGLLRSAGISPRRVHRALRQLKKQLPAGRPLSGVRIYTDAGQIVVRDRDAVWQPESGQQVFHFAVDGSSAAPTLIMAAAARRRGAIVASESAADWFDYGVMIEHEDPNGARAAYERALELDAELVDAYINLGRLVHEGGDPRGAVRFYAEALRRGPDDAVIHYNLAVAYEDLERLGKARSHYQRALELNPRFADAHFNLGKILENAGEREEALKHLLAYRRLSD